MIKFDLERAKAGDPIEYNHLRCRWIPCSLVSVGPRTGMAIIETDIHNFPFAPSENDLRMAPKKVTVRYRMCLEFDSSERVSVSTTNDLPGYISPAGIENGPGFIKWIHDDWQEITIPQPDLTDKEIL